MTRAQYWRFVIRRTLLLIPVCAGVYAGARALLSFAYPTLHARYRFTIEVMAGGKLYTGSDIVDVTFEMGTSLHEMGSNIVSRMSSHCPSIDLGPHGILFVVNSISGLSDPRPLPPNRNWPFGLYPDSESLTILPFALYPLRPKGYAYVSALLNHEPVSGALSPRDGEIDVPIERLPMIVHLAEVDVTSSWEELDPKDMSSAFGPGSRVVRASLRITDDPLTPTPAYWPAWIAEMKSSSFKVEKPSILDNMPYSGYILLLPRQIKGEQEDLSRPF